MGCSPLPACAQAVDRSQLDSDWNPHHVRWLPATVWAAQYAARGTEGFFSKTSAVSQMCSACPKVATQKLRIVVMENGRMECAGQDRGSRYRTARNYLLQGNSAMDQQQYSEAWGYVQKALVIGKQLKDWTVQSNALRVLSLCCRPMGGPQDSERNVTWWDEALTEARKHGDPFLEAMVLKTMGYAAAQKYGDYRALEESAQLWLAIMKALRLRGESGEPGLRRCPTQMLITKQYLAMGKKKGGGWEGLLREALVYGDMLGNNDDELHQRYCVLQLLANKCETDLDALKSPRGQVWRDKAAVYRQHAMAVLERMGQPVPKDCLLCSTAHKHSQAQQKSRCLPPQLWPCIAHHVPRQVKSQWCFGNDMPYMCKAGTKKAIGH